MRSPRRCAAFVLALAASMLAPAQDAGADDKQTCLDATDAAQQLRIDGKLTAARERLLVCARPECPLIVRQDCSQWLLEVVAALPTVVLGARDAQGRDLFDVKVTVDGTPVVERLDGRPFAIDPGRHVFRFERAGRPAPSVVELPVLVRQGEQNREITAAFATTAAPPATAVPSMTAVPTTPAEGTARPSSGTSPLVWVLGGTGIAALGTSLAFLIAQDVEYNHLAATCGGHCTPAQVDPVSTERAVAAWTAVGGGVALAAAACIFVLGRPSGNAVSVDVTPGPHGAVGAIVGRF
jgi:hypothetical protein